MKRIMAFALAVILLTSFCGCAVKDDKEGKWMAFYYCRGDMSSHVPSGVLTREMRQIPEGQTDPEKILELYLQGPRMQELKNVFPPNCRLVSLTVEEELTEVCLSREIGQLEGMDLTIACACLAKTLMEFNGTQTLRIRGQNMVLAGQEYIEMRYGDLIMDDKSAVTTEPTEP